MCDSVAQVNEELPVKWAHDSSFFVYEKDGNIYFCNPEALLTNVEVDESFRKIGRGSINSVNWISDNSLIYIDDYLVYQISSKELTLPLYIQELLDEEERLVVYHSNLIQKLTNLV
mgnify:CR=1 FL=1